MDSYAPSPVGFSNQVSVNIQVIDEVSHPQLVWDFFSCELPANTDHAATAATKANTAADKTEILV